MLRGRWQMASGGPANRRPQWEGCQATFGPAAGVQPAIAVAQARQWRVTGVAQLIHSC